MEGKDLTKGNLIKNMFKLLIPIVFINLLNSLYNIVDAIWIGRLIGESGVSAITNCYPIILFILAFGVAISTSAAVLVSRFYGEKDDEKIKTTMGTAYLLSLVLSIVIAILMFIFSEILLKALNTPLEILQDARTYLVIYVCGLIFNFLLMVIMEGLKAIGNSKTPLIFVGIGAILNIILDPIFIKIGSGIKGAAIATLISMIISSIIGIIYINKKSKLLKIDIKYLKLNYEYFKNIVKIGLPIIVQQWGVTMVITFEVYIANISGVIGSAAYGVISKLEQVFLVVAGSFTTVATVTVGQFIGNKKVEEAKVIIKEGLKLGIVPTILIAIIVFVIQRPIVGMFVESETVIEIALKYLAVVGIAYVLLPTRQLVNGFIIGTAHTGFIILTSIVANIFEIGTILILRNNGTENLTALGWGIIVWMVVEMSMQITYVISNKWQKEVI